MSLRLPTSRAAILTVLCLAGTGTPMVVRLMPEAWTTLRWLIDLASHWQWLYVGAASGCALAWTIRRRWRWLLATLLVPLPAVFASVGRVTLPPIDRAMPVLTVVSANLHLENPELGPIRTWVEDLNADVVVLQEVTPEHAVALEQWESYRFRAIAAEYSPFGMAVMSRHPLTTVETHSAAGEPPSFRVLLDWDGRMIALAAVHPMPPISARDHVTGVAGLLREAAWVARAAPLGLLAGDLNTSPWGLAFDGAAGVGLARASPLAPTWPAVSARFGIGIPIDHLLTGEGWAVTASGRGPFIGSDHLPVFARLTLAQP